MATMVAYTALELTEAQKRALCAGVEKGASEAFEIDISITELMLMPTIPPECHGPSVTGRAKAPVGQKSLRCNRRGHGPAREKQSRRHHQRAHE